MVLGWFRERPVSERRARGELERVYHEIRETLRVTGVNLVFRRWAAIPDALPAVWEALRPIAETRALEDAADALRAEAVEAVSDLPRPGAAAAVALGPSQAFQLDAALDLYRYVNPKLLLLVAATRLALEGRAALAPAIDASAERVERGAPADMAAMELVPSRPRDPQLRALFQRIARAHEAEEVNSDYRTLALWPRYLEAAWEGLERTMRDPRYPERARRLRERARTLAAPGPLALSPRALRARGVDVDDFAHVTASFERILPQLILNVSLIALERRGVDDLKRSPFPPAAARREAHEVAP